MKLLIAAVALAAIAGVYLYTRSNPTPEPVEEAFANYVSQFRKSYFSADEYSMRLATFKKNLAEIETLNREDTATYGVNQYSDWTHEEFMVLNGALEQEDPATVYVEDNAGVTPQGSVDWRSKGVLNPVKDQGSCGSCWAFATAGVASDKYCIGTGGKESHVFSPQYLVDCNTKESACRGADTIRVIPFIEEHGLPLESCYPYESGKTKEAGVCHEGTCTADLMSNEDYQHYEF